VFAKPVTVSLPLPAGVTSASIYFSKLGSPTEFESIGGTIANGMITAQTPHFSRAVIGRPTRVRTVNGIGATTWISATSRQTVPQDFAAVPAEVIVRDAAGNLVSIPGIGGALGTFTIPGVPNGEYILHAGNHYLVTSTNAPDLGTSRGGRPDLTPLYDDAFLDFHLTGLAPWDDASQLEFFSTEADDWDFVTNRVASDFDGIPEGQTEVSFRFDLSWTDGSPHGPSLIEGSKGDHLYVAQLSNATSSSGVPYIAMSRLVQFAPFDAVSGGNVPLNGAMLNVQQGNTIAADFRGSAFREAIVPDANPNTVFGCPDCGATFGVLGQAGTARDGFYTSNVDLLLLGDPGGADLQTGTMSYGSPANAGLVGSWGEIGLVRWIGQVFPQLPGALPAFQPFFSGINWTADARDFGAPRVLTPPISLVRNFRIDGQNAFADQTLGSLTPTVAWDAPAIGTPTLYSIDVFKLDVNPSNNRTFRQKVATIFTPNRSFTFLPGILQSGHHYLFQMSAIDAPEQTNAPFRTVLNSASAFTPSGILTAP
jgi:hypothetical protein